MKFSNPENIETIGFRKLIILCVLVGLVAGLGASGFFVMLQAGSSYFLGAEAHYFPVSPGREKPLFEFGEVSAKKPINRYLLLILPIIGGLFSGLITFFIAPEAEGHGTDAAIEAYHYKDGYVRARVPLVKAITSMFTIATGGSGGREGPIAQIGSGFASILGTWAKVPPAEHRILMAAGMGAGIGAIFHAPLAGALFAAEVLYKGPDLEHEVLVPTFMTSIVAYSVFGVFFGFHPLFITPDYHFNHPMMLIPFLILGLVSTGGAILYVKAFYGFRHLMFDKLKLPNHIKPAIGGIGVGIIGFFLPEALGTGYGVLQTCFNYDVKTFPAIANLSSFHVFNSLFSSLMNPTILAAVLLAVIALGKIATTAFSIGSGGSGGVFGPAVVIGGALGGATGLICMQLFPNMSIQPGAFAIVGMAGFFAGAANTPISTIIMVSEMTGNYNLLLPAMFVCLISFLLCQKYTLYEKQLPSRLEAPSKIGDMARAILRRLTIKNALNLRAKRDYFIVPQSMHFHDLLKRYTLSPQEIFPVVDQERNLIGIIEGSDIRQIALETSVEDLVIAYDIARPVRMVSAHKSLLTAANIMAEKDLKEVIIVDDDAPETIIGILNQEDILRAYNRQIAQPKSFK